MRLRLLALTLALAALTALAASRLDVARERPYDLETLPSSRTLRWLSLGHPTLAANLFWLKTVQYVGEPRANERGWEKLYPAVDLVTDLDPRHGYAYQVAGILLGSVGRVAESNAILEKGTARFRDRYILPYLRAFNAFFYDNDFVAAAKYAEIAAAKEGAPAHVRGNVLAYYVKGRRPDAAIAYLESVLPEARDDESRKALLRQLAQARLERDALAVEEAVASWRTRTGVRPVAIATLVADGFLAAVPRDPFGGDYYLDGDGRLRSTVGEFRFSDLEIDRRGEPGVHPERYDEENLR
jgi:tetratricopeptide (TPR) repeat protein